jgi:pantoate--beta-alanine ligase
VDDSPPLRWIHSIDEIRGLVNAARGRGERVGLVPTMGALHDGHRSLLVRARGENDLVVATLFVNPLQFAPGEDFHRYPRTEQQDGELCAAVGVNAIFAPSVETMYPPASCTRVQVTGLEDRLCGRSRPGHFVGVATVVLKLFNIVPADVAYFGLKDFQQAKIIERMVADLNLPIAIRLCPTVREADGLAMSSRNRYLTVDERAQAVALYQSLQLARSLVAGGERSAERIRDRMRRTIESRPLARIDYVELVDPQTLEAAPEVTGPTVAAVAVRFGGARLIDNELLVP